MFQRISLLLNILEFPLLNLFNIGLSLPNFDHLGWSMYPVDVWVENMSVVVDLRIC